MKTSLGLLQRFFQPLPQLIHLRRCAADGDVLPRVVSTQCKLQQNLDLRLRVQTALSQLRLQSPTQPVEARQQMAVLLRLFQRSTNFLVVLAVERNDLVQRILRKTRLERVLQLFARQLAAKRKPMRCKPKPTLN